MYRFVVLYLFILCGSSANSQVDFEPTSSLRVEMGLPAPIEVATNQPFRDFMHGLLNLSVGYQYNFENGLTVGAGSRYALFNVNEFRNTFQMSGTLHFAGVHGRLGYEKYWGSLGVDMGIKGGYNLELSNINFCIDELGRAKQTYGLYVEPNISLSIVVGENENNAFTLGNLAYTFHDMRFDPAFVCHDNFPGQNPDTYSNITSYLTFGFGYTYYFGK